MPAVRACASLGYIEEITDFLSATPAGLKAAGEVPPRYRGAEV